MALGDEPVSFNRKSADLIGRTVKRMSGMGRGELPLPKRRRGGVDGGGSDRASVAATMMVLTEAMDAATGDTSSITPATALAQLYETDTDTFVRTPTDDEPIEILNYDTNASYSVNTAVWVATTTVDGVDITEIISVSCSPLGEPA